MKIPLSLIIICAVLSGCFFARVDYDYKDDFSQDKTRVSATVWTIGKHVVIDPNGYNSDPDTVSVITPWVGAEMGE